jgi:mxaJ protein
MNNIHLRVRSLLALATGAALSLQITLASAAEPLRVCAANDEMPYSNAAGEGFENRLARRVADLLGRPLEMIQSDRPAIYHVQEYLNAGKCDVIMGLDSTDPRVLTTKPYYRASYVFVLRRDDGPDIRDWDPEVWQQVNKVAFAQGSPAEAMIREVGLFERNLSYMYSLIGFKPKRNQYVRFHPSRLVSEVSSGVADVAIVWGPEAAPYVARSTVPLEMRPVPDGTWQGTPVSFQYEQSMGVRQGDTELRDALDQVIATHGPALRAELADLGIPVTEPEEARVAVKQ